jgi:hypothetical protein
MQVIIDMCLFFQLNTLINAYFYNLSFHVKI